MTKARFCCINVTSVARFIGIFDLIASILAIYYLTEEYFSDKKRSIVFRDIRTIFGFNWSNTSTVKNSTRNELDDTSTVFCLIIYSTIYSVSSVGLILATIFRNKNCTLPWLTMEIISLANQASTVILILLQQRCENDDTSGSFPLASFYLLVGIYSWIIVFAAQKSWPDLSSDANFAEANDEEISDVIDIHRSKINSTLTVQSQTNLEPPKPSIFSKYYVQV